MQLFPARILCVQSLRGLSGVVVVAALALASTGPAQAQWKWRDASGRIQFSDLPPPSQVPDKDILQRPGPPGAAKAPAVPASTPPASAKPALTAARTTADGDLDQRRKAEDQERKARKQAEDERLSGQRQDNCQRAREAVATLESGQRIARVNARGEREILSDEQRAEDLRRAKAVVASDCR